MLPRFADFFQQGNRWLNWLHKQPEGGQFGDRKFLYVKRII